MLIDKMSCFSFKQTIPPAQSTTGTDAAKIIDTRFNGGLDDHLRIFAMHTGAPLTAGAITTEVQTCDTEDGKYEKIAEGTLDGNWLLDVAFPRNAKRFVKLVYKVTTALSNAVEVYAGLVPETEIRHPVRVAQTSGCPIEPKIVKVVNKDGVKNAWHPFVDELDVTVDNVGEEATVTVELIEKPTGTVKCILPCIEGNTLERVDAKTFRLRLSANPTDCPDSMWVDTASYETRLKLTSNLGEDSVVLDVTR